MSIARYDALARLVAYPEADIAQSLRLGVELHERSHPQTAEALNAFGEAAPIGDLVALRELHTRTFDVQPITSLDVGYTLFGEDYKRGAMLANLSREHSTVGNDCGLELADNLSNVLRLLPIWQDPAVRDEFVRVLLGPAVREMIREFEPERIEKKVELYKRHHKTVIAAPEGPRRLAYLHCLVAVERALTQDFSVKVALPVNQDSKFMGAVSAEMAIEEGGSCAAQ